MEIKDEKKATTILIADDDNSTRILLSNILNEYNVITAENGEDVFEKIRKGRCLPDLILLDVIMLTGINGYQVCMKLKKNPQTSNIPIIFLTIAGNIELEEHGLGIGADDYIVKPIEADRIKARVEKILEQKKQHELEIIKSQSELIFIFGNLVEDRSGETVNHVQRVGQYAVNLGIKAGLSAGEVRVLEIASPMHDIGKIYIPDAVLNKTAELTFKERKLIDTHTQKGFDLLKNSGGELLKAAAVISYQHHERWDGEGYPQGLKAEKIHIYGRIAAIVDAFDAMATWRCYRKAWDKDRIIKEFKKQSGKQFDPKLTELFLEHIDEFFRILKKYPDKN